MKLNSLAVAYWLNDQTHQIDQSIPSEVCQQKYLPGVHRELSDLRLLVDEESVGGQQTFSVREDAVESVEDLAARYRPEAIRRGVLKEISEHPDEGGTDEYLERINILGGPVTDQELRDEVVALHTEGLIKGSESSGYGAHLFRPELTPEGQKVLSSRNIELGSLLPKVPTTSTPTPKNSQPVITINGDNAQISWDNRSVNQSHQHSEQVTTGYEAIAGHIGELLKILPVLQLEKDEAQEVRKNVDIMLGEIVKEEPDRNLVKRYGTMISGILSPIVLGLSGAVSDEVKEIVTRFIGGLS